MPKPLGTCPKCGGQSVNATTWTNHYGEPEGAAWCEVVTCGWSFPESSHHSAKALKAREAEALANWHADVAAHPELAPY